ncbi:MAG: diguanylate cyclase [Anaerolineaceae bacterium]|jgi:diguanylate cyclase (GGDEF)-like protein/PAS domain S-box-containing protein
MQTAGVSNPLFRWIKPIVASAAFLAFFLLADRFSTLIQVSAGIPDWYPTSGVSLAFLILFGLEYAPVVFGAVLLTGLWFHQVAFGLSLLILAIFVTSGYGLTAYIINNVLHIDPRLNRSRDATLLILTVLATSVIVAALNALVFLMDRRITTAGYQLALIQLWVTDAITILVVAPVFLVMRAPLKNLFTSSRASLDAIFHFLISQRMLLLASEILLQVALVAMVVMAIFSWTFTENSKPFYLCFLVLIAICLRHGIIGAVIGNAITATGVFLAGYFMAYQPVNIAELQLFLVTLSMTGLVLGSVVTENKDGEKALRAAEARYRQMVEQALIVIYIKAADRSGSILYISPQIEALTGYPPDEWVEDKNLWEKLLHPDDRDSVQSEIKRMNETRQPLASEYRMIARNEQVVWIRDEAVLVKDEKGKPRFWQGVLHDITQRRRREEELWAQSTQDSLTGLHSRAFFDAELTRLQNSRLFPISVVMMDMDGLKMVNDSLGHAAGDELLRQTGLLLRGSFRSEDIIARIGGDEFAILLPDTDAAEANAIISRLKTNLAVYNRNHPDLPISISIGVATGQKGTLLGDVLKQADGIMYQQKTWRRKV